MMMYKKVPFFMMRKSTFLKEFLFYIKEAVLLLKPSKNVIYIYVKHEQMFKLQRQSNKVEIIYKCLHYEFK